MTTSAFQVGFVGVGRMGANMARRLKDKGYRLTAVYDIDQARSASLAKELRCSLASTPAEVAKGSNTVMTVVTDDAAMRVLFSASDPAGLLPFGDGRLFINCATLSPEVHVEIEERAKKNGAQTLEACMASSIPQAREGTLYLMCGGERAVFDRAKPLLEDLGRSIRYIGKAGEAAKVKALVNMVMNINTAALAEGLGLGAALGLDLTLLREVFSQTGAASRVLETDGADMQNREHDCYFSAAHAAKDSGIALKLSEDYGSTLPLAEATYAQYRRLIDIGKGELDKSAVAELTFPGRGKE
ncbi:MAG: NAD(P)-dependent oxidoreductase [Candidatus Manganitrophus sp. SB1]|nr:NAD(P)-dependent oxidoreductase [Candidatus Manganitrophus morganii]